MRWWMTFGLPPCSRSTTSPTRATFPPAILDRIGVPSSFYRIENGVEFFGNVSFSKAGIALADRMTTVSPTYAREIQTPELGAGLDGLLRFRSRASARNPERHRRRNLESADRCEHSGALRRALGRRQKDANRDALLDELQLDGRGPLLVSREQARASERYRHSRTLLSRSCWNWAPPSRCWAMVTRRPNGPLHAPRAANPGRVAAFFKFDDPLSRRFYAGGDFFIMPSRYEPCGLGQMIAQRYGTVPIVRRTGGLIDTVEDGETGFVFDDPTPEALVEAAQRALRSLALARTWPNCAAAACGSTVPGAVPPSSTRAFIGPPLDPCLG